MRLTMRPRLTAGRAGHGDLFDQVGSHSQCTTVQVQVLRGKIYSACLDQKRQDTIFPNSFYFPKRVTRPPQLSRLICWVA